MEGKEFQNKIKPIEQENKELEQELISIGFAFIALNKIKKENIIFLKFKLKN
jgi:hypothetical protein